MASAGSFPEPVLDIGKCSKLLYSQKDRFWEESYWIESPYQEWLRVSIRRSPGWNGRYGINLTEGLDSACHQYERKNHKWRPDTLYIGDSLEVFYRQKREALRGSWADRPFLTGAFTRNGYGYYIEIEPYDVPIKTNVSTAQKSMRWALERLVISFDEYPGNQYQDSVIVFDKSLFKHPFLRRDFDFFDEDTLPKPVMNIPEGYRLKGRYTDTKMWSLNFSPDSAENHDIHFYIEGNKHSPYRRTVQIDLHEPGLPSRIDPGKRIIAKDTVHTSGRIPFFVYTFEESYKVSADSVSYTYYVYAKAAYRGYSYWISAQDWPRESKRTIPEAKLLVRKIIEGFSQFPQRKMSFENRWECYEELYELMHSRPFWISGADTLGPIKPAGDAYPVDATPVATLLDIGGFAEDGLVVYRLGNSDGNNISISWLQREASDSNNAVDQNVDQGWIWDTTFVSTFKGYPVEVSVMEYPKGMNKRDYSNYTITTFHFTRQDAKFAITARSRDKTSSLGIDEELWNWLETNWLWKNEKPNYFSRYPLEYHQITLPD